MTAVVLTVVGMAISIAFLVAAGLAFRSHDGIHHVVDEFGFAPWIDVWQLSGRRPGGGEAVGTVRQCLRARVAGVPVELAQATDLAHQFWLVAARVPRGPEFTVSRRGVAGELPAGCADVLGRGLPRAVDEVSCADGLMVVRASSSRGVRECLTLLVGCVQRLGDRSS